MLLQSTGSHEPQKGSMLSRMSRQQIAQHAWRHVDSTSGIEWQCYNAASGTADHACTVPVLSCLQVVRGTPVQMSLAPTSEKKDQRLHVRLRIRNCLLQMSKPFQYLSTEHTVVKGANDRCKISITGGLARSPCQVYASSLCEELCTSSTPQRGGGSFKNRKPVGL